MNRLRLLVDSNHPQWALALRTAGFEAFESVQDGDIVDIAFIDSGNGDGQDRLARVRRERSHLPVIVYSQDATADDFGPDVTLVRPPLTVEALSELIRRMARVDPPEPDRPAALVREPPPQDARSTGTVVTEQAESPESLPTAAVAVKDRPARSEAGSTWRSGTPHSPVDKKPAPSKPTRPRRRAADRLESAVHEVTSLEPTPGRLLGELVTALATTAAADVAILRQDDAGAWVAAAGHGLRSIETRPVRLLPAAVAALDDRATALAVGETDALRSSLAGFPLARHKCLLLLRHPPDLLTVLGREDPFVKRDVQLAMSVVRKALAPLHDALRIEAALLDLVAWYEG